MNTKTWTWLLFGAWLVAVPLTAQRPGPVRPGMGARGPMGPGMRGGEGLERALTLALERRDSLGLTDDQVAELESLRAEVEQSGAGLRAGLERVREQGGGRREVMDSVRNLMEGTRAEREAQRARFEQLLTEDQRARLRPLQRDARRPRGPGQVRGRPGPGGGRFGPALGPGGPGGGPGARLSVARAYRMGWFDGLRAGARFRAGRMPFAPPW